VLAHRVVQQNKTKTVMKDLSKPFSKNPPCNKESVPLTPKPT